MEYAQEIPPLSNKQKLAFFAMVVGMFMAILDIQIVASSLSVIAAGLAASTDELSWVQTSYLIAEVIIIPMTGFLARLLSIRIAYFVAALGFTVMSVMCSLAWNIESMILFRALQGFFGGAMIPTVFSTVFIIFPIEKRSIVTIIIGLVVTIAPTLGPTLGGYVTEIFSWHFMFLLNVLPGIFVCTAVYLYADFDKPNLNLLNNFDFLGIFLLATSLGSLEYVLEEGNKNGWMEDTLLLSLTVYVVIAFIVLIIHELTCKNPLLDLSAFKDRNFTLGCAYSFTIGIGLYGAVYILPLFLFSVTGYSTIQIGVTMMVTGVFQFLSAPIAGKMLGKGVDLRLMLAFGLILFSLGCYTNSFLTPDSAYWEFFLPQAIRGFSLMFCFVPTNNIALGTMPRSKVQNASGLYNLTRNLGGAIGLAVINSVLSSKTKMYSQYLGENLSTSSYLVSNSIFYLSHIFGDRVIDSHQAALQTIAGIIHRDAFIIAINNIFSTLSVLFLIPLAFVAFTKLSNQNSGSGAH